MPNQHLRAWTLALAALPLCAHSASAAPISAPTFTGGSAAHPSVIELFQSQGCSSCPPATALLNAIADRGDVLALSFAVTYWDQLGWKDTFGSPGFTARQQDYAAAGRGEVATPELIVNGTYAVVGSDRRAVAAALTRGGAPSGGPQIAGDTRTVRLGSAGAGAPATVWLVRFDPATRNVAIRAGENGGLTLPHRDIVRELVRLGEWQGTPENLALPPAHEAGLVSAVLIQRGRGGPIIAAGRLG